MNFINKITNVFSSGSNLPSLELTSSKASEKELDELEKEFEELDLKKMSIRYIKNLSKEIIASDFSISSPASIENFRSKISELKDEIPNLTSDQLENHKDLFLRVYGTMNDVQEVVKQNKSIKDLLLATQAAFRTKANYLNADLALVTSFCVLGQGLSRDPQSAAGKLLVMAKQRTLSIGETSNKDEQNAVFHKLKTLGIALNKPALMSGLLNDQLIELKLVSCSMMVGYLGHQESGLDLVEANFTQLNKINDLVQQEISKRSDRGFAADPEFAIAFALLKEEMPKALYSEAFWDDKKGVNELVGLKNHIKAITNFMKDPNIKKLGDLLVVGSDKDAGLFLFKGKEGEYVLMLNPENDQKFSHFDFRQSTESGLNGLGHAPIYEGFNKIQEKANLFLKQEIKDDSFKLTITGFGLGGGVAQLLANEEAKKNIENQYVACCIGTPAYLDPNAAASLSETVNLYSFNFSLYGDKFVKASAFSPLVAKGYAAESDTFNAVYPLFNRDWSALDITGHDANIYEKKIERAVDQPITMHKIYEEVQLLSQPTAQN